MLNVPLVIYLHYICVGGDVVSKGRTCVWGVQYAIENTDVNGDGKALNFLQYHIGFGKEGESCLWQYGESKGDISVTFEFY